MTDRVRGLRRSYLNLELGEIVSAVVFCGAMLWVSPRLGANSDRLAAWAALAPLIVVLLQAGVYWLTARTWIGRGGMPRLVRSVYRCFRVLDAVLLAAGPVVVVGTRPGAVALVLALGVWLFGVAEYVNYFVVRLAYPAHRWLAEVGRRRTPRLAKDLCASDPASG